MYRKIKNLRTFAADGVPGGDGASQVDENEQATEDPESSERENEIDAAALQTEIRKLRRENAKWRTQLRQLEETREQAQQAELSEVERLKAQVSKLEQSAQQAQANAKRLVVRNAATLAATKAGVRADALDLVIGLIDPDDLELSEDGQVEGLQDTIQEIVKARPFLTEQTTTNRITPTNPAEGGTGETYEQQRKRLLYPSRNAMFGGGTGGGVLYTPKE